MQQMSTAVEQVAGNSQTAADASQRAAQAARQGGIVADQALATMRSIAGSTECAASRIAELGKNSSILAASLQSSMTLRSKTNLLALNAAIEAARAGAQGRGFAVVADEVRKLAERTTKATKEIAEMVRTIQSERKNAVEAMRAGSHDVEVGVGKTTESGVCAESDHRGCRGGRQLDRLHCDCSQPAGQCHVRRHAEYHPNLKPGPGIGDAAEQAAAVVRRSFHADPRPAEHSESVQAG